METIIQIQNSVSTITFYPTYKEWKHKRRIDRKIEIFSFYPTYKEWKL